MLEIELKLEYWDEVNEVFVNTNGQTIHLEHSLFTISKWESKWKKPFLNSDKTDEELLDYIKCMCQEEVGLDVIANLGVNELERINDYINDPMSATTVSNEKKGKSKRVVTSELIYYWMTALNIPWECQHWHLNRLLKLIEVCNIENNPKQMGKQDVMKQNRELNAARRKALRSKG